MNALQNYIDNGNLTEDYLGVCVTNTLKTGTSCSSLLILPIPATLPVPSNILPNKVYLFSNLNQARTLIGINSVAFNALNIAFCSCNTNKTAIHAVFLPVETTAVAQVATLETTAIVAAHYKTISLGGVTKTVFFPAAMSAAAAAALIMSVFNAEPTFEHVITATGAVLTITAKDKGLYDPYYNITYTDSRLPPIIVDAPLINISVTTQGSGGLDTTGLLSALGSCCFACTSLASAEYVTMKNVYTIYDSKNNVCYGQNCFGVLHVAIKGTATDNTNFGNFGDASRPWNVKATTLGVMQWEIYAPYQVAVGRSVLTCCKSCDDPENPFINSDSQMLCLPAARSCYDALSSADYKAMWDAGITPVVSINGYLGVKRERFSYRFEINGDRITSIVQPSDYRVLKKYHDLLESFIMTRLGSVYVFTGNTQIPENSYTAQLPAAMRNKAGYSMNQVYALFSDFHKSLIGIIFDQQDFDSKLGAFLDNQIRKYCEGDPTALVLIGENLIRVRAISKVRVGVSTTTYNC